MGQSSAEYKKQWALDNAEKVKAQKRACYLRHKERYNAANKAWYEENKEVANEKSKQRYRENKEEHLAKGKERYERVKDTPEHKAKQREYQEANKEIIAAKAKQWREENAEEIRARKKEYRANNKEVIAERKKIEYEQNKEYYRTRSMVRKRKNRRATPSWAKKTVFSKYSELRKEADILEEITGVVYHVDHICPIQGSLLLDKEYVRLVSGLNVDYNLQLLSASENMSKNCFSWPDMWTYTKEDLAEIAARSVPCDMELPRFNIKEYRD